MSPTSKIGFKEEEFARAILINVAGKAPYVGMVLGPIIGIFWTVDKGGAPSVDWDDVKMAIQEVVRGTNLKIANNEFKTLGNYLLGYRDYLIGPPYSTPGSRAHAWYDLQLKMNAEKHQFINPHSVFPEQAIVTFSGFANLHLNLLEWGTKQPKGQKSEEGLTTDQIENFTRWLGDAQKGARKDYSLHVQKLKTTIMQNRMEKITATQYDPGVPETTTLSFITYGSPVTIPPTYYFTDDKFTWNRFDNPDLTSIEEERNRYIKDVRTHLEAELETFVNPVVGLTAETLRCVTYGQTNREYGTHGKSVYDPYEPKLATAPAGILRKKIGESIWVEENWIDGLLLPESATGQTGPKGGALGEYSVSVMNPYENTIRIKPRNWDGTYFEIDLKRMSLISIRSDSRIGYEYPIVSAY